MSKVLRLYNKAASLPFGKRIFSILFCLKAPYFSTIRPLVKTVRAGYGEISMKQRWGVQNHIATVHAIAVCNLIEMTMGIVAECTIPSHLRWLPKGMDVNYLKKATGTLTASSTVDPATIFELEKYPGDVSIPVVVKNVEGVTVTSADVRLWVSEKPKMT